MEKKGLRLILLSDPGNLVARKYSLAYELPGDLRKLYLGYGVDLGKFNGDDSWTLPMPARFVIDRSGIVRSAEVNADYTIRPEPEETVRILRCMSQSPAHAQDRDFEACVKAA